MTITTTTSIDGKDWCCLSQTIKRAAIRVSCRKIHQLWMYSEAKAQPHNDSKQEMDWIGGQGQKSLGFPTHIGNTHYFA